jgi:GTP-binding protein
MTIFSGQAVFTAGAAEIDRIPSYFLPEVAFIGKSNVGKSSLINTVCNHHNLAKVSKTPGRTQQINFFTVANKIILADLPGYGFADVPNYKHQEWEKLILYYLKNRYNLKLVNVLIDARRNIKSHDLEILSLLSSYNKHFQIVFTKIDKISDKTELLNSSKNLLASLGYSCNLITTSSRSREGAKELQFSLERIRS